MAKIEPVWCVKPRFGTDFCATNTGKRPVSSRLHVRSLCGKTIYGDESRLCWPDCPQCLDILCVRAQKKAKASDTSQLSLGDAKC